MSKLADMTEIKKYIYYHLLSMQDSYESIEDNEEQSLLNIVHKSNLLINEITKFQIKHKDILLYDDFVKESLAKKVVKWK